MNVDQFEKIGIQDVFLKNTFEGCVVRITHINKETKTDGKCFVKFPGESEYEVAASTDIIMDTVDEFEEIMEDEYKNF